MMMPLPPVASGVRPLGRNDQGWTKRAQNSIDRHLCLMRSPRTLPGMYGEANPGKQYTPSLLASSALSGHVDEQVDL